jgi:hypothetical protein
MKFKKVDSMEGKAGTTSPLEESLSNSKLSVYYVKERTIFLNLKEVKYWFTNKKSHM